MKKLVIVVLSLIMLSSCSVKPKDGVLSISEPTGIVKINIDTLGEDVPSSKDDGELPVKVTFNGGKDKFTSDATIRVQGSSTARWPKKNWRFKFFEDESLDEKILLKIGDSVESDKWIAKAEWIDPSMLRNYVSYNLWGDIVESRGDEPKLEVEHGLQNDQGKTGAQGYPTTYVSQITVNDEHYGIAILLMGHEPNNFNIDKNNPNHIYMEFDARGGYTPIKTWEKFSSEGIGQWIDGYYPKNEDFTEEHKQAIDRLGDFINGDLENFKDNFDNYLDKTNMIDMLLFLEMVYDWDAVAQDVEIVTYDLEKWFFLPWDKDTTFGMNWEGSGIRKDSEYRLLFNYEEEEETQSPWFKTYHSFKDDVETRYAELRDNNVFTVENIKKLTDEVNTKIPDELWDKEYKRWEADGRPSVEEATTEQLLDWVEKRLEVLDKHFNYDV